MKDYRFDELTKELAAKPVSRRRALRLLLAGTAAGLLSTVTAPSAYAQRPCRAVGQTCQSDAQCCTRYCDNQTFRCGCPPGSQLCENQSTCLAECSGGHQPNLQTCQCECRSPLPKDCGAVCCASDAICCGNTCCPSGTVCTQGNVCCPADRACGGECCPPGFTCSGGACVGPPAQVACGSPCSQNNECAQAALAPCRQCRPVAGQPGLRTCGGVL
jgi:hypothetical protein